MCVTGNVNKKRLPQIIPMFSYLLRRYSFLFYRGKVMKKEEVHKIVVHNFVNSIEEPHKIDPSPYFSPLFVSKTI